MTVDDFLEAHLLPRWKDWNRTYDQSHIQHAMVVGVFGLWSWVCWRLGIAAEWSSQGSAVGLLTGTIGYIYREYSWRLLAMANRSDPKADLNWWDGHMDWLVPAWIYWPWALDQFGYHKLSAVWLVISTTLVFMGYSFWRPKGKLMYGA